MRGLWRRLSLRGRLLVVGTVGVAVALAIGSLSLYVVLGLAGMRTLDAAAGATAADVVQLVEEGRLPEPIPVTGSQIVQVVDADDRVLSASTNADRLTSLLGPAEVARALDAPVTVPGSRIGLSSPLRVTAERAEAGTGGSARRTVLVAQQFDDVADAQRILGVTLLATYPLLLVVLVLIAWRVVGATLRPVEALRSAADQISGTGQGDRLPLPASRDEIHALALTLNSMLDRLAAARDRQRSFVADAAHELRSPLASMRTQLEVADRRGEAPDVLPDLVEEVQRMTGLVDDLLVLARLDATPDGAPDDDQPRPVELDLLLAEVVARFADARVPVTLVPGPSVVLALARPEHLDRVVTNLLTNGVRHARSQVQVELLADATEVRITVTDDGEGVPEAQREEVFERFTRLDEARDRDAGGSGLGLAIVRQLVQGLGGSVAIGEAARGGAEVVVRLPRAGRT